MDILEKGKELFNKAVEKAEEAVNTGMDAIEKAKLEAKIKENTTNIGAVILALLDSGEQTANTKISALYNEIIELRAKIAEIDEKK